MTKPPKQIRDYLSKLGRRGGKAKTPAKLKAIAKNSRKTRYCPQCGHGWKHKEHQTTCKLTREGE